MAVVTQTFLVMVLVIYIVTTPHMPHDLQMNQGLYSKVYNNRDNNWYIWLLQLNFQI